MNANRKSDESIEPATSANEGTAEVPEESAEERDSAKRNAKQDALLRTPSRTKRKSRGLYGVREAARKDSTLKFTALLHHVNEDCLTEAFFNLKKTAAVGVDGVTWQEYERNLEANIADLLRLIRKWLRAGVSEDGEWSKTTVGAPQGSVISPLFSNVYLHYVLDLWIAWWRQHCCRGDVIVVRYADDFAIGFENHNEAVACLEELRTRFAKFGLKLHEGKTRLIEFGRYADERRKRRGEGRPETFGFLGFTHMCSRTRKQGWFAIHRHSIAKRMRATLQAIKVELRKRMHRPIGETARWLRRVVQGWLNYHAVPSNSHRIGRFVDEVTRLWLAVLRRRSQRGRRRWTWDRAHRLVRRHLPRPHIIHPYPEKRLHARLKARAV